MRNILLFIVFFAILIAGCANRNFSGRQYYEKGLDFLENGNPNGAIIAFKKAIERDQSYFEARYQLASAYILRGKYESAERELLKVLRLNPSLKEAHLSLAKVYLNIGRTDAALKEAALYLKDTDDDPEAYEIAAAAYAAGKDYAGAEESINKSLSISPERISSKIVLAEIYIANGKNSQAEAVVKEVLEAEGGNKKALYLLARIQNKQDNIDGMISTYKRILDADPEDAAAMFELGLAYLRKNDLEKTKEIALKLTGSHKNRAEGPYLMGLVYFQEKKTDEAIISFQESLKKASIPGAYYYLGLSHMAKGNLEQATSEFQRVIDLRPGMVQARLLLAVAHLKGGRAEDAEREVKKALEMDENNAFAHNLLGSVYLSSGRGDSAMEEFDKAIELNPGLVDAHIKKGAFNLLSGNDEKAEREFLNAVEIAPELLNSRIILARYYIKSKKFREAIDILKKGLKENPDDAILYNIMGMVYFKSRDIDKAGQYFEKAIASKPEFFLPYFNLAVLYLNKDEKEKAIDEYKRVLEIENNNVTALLMLAKIMEAEKREREALAYYIKAKDQGEPIAYLSLAEHYYKKNEREKAVKVLEEALRNNPEDVKAMDMKGRIYLAGKDYQSALLVYKDMAAVAPETGKQRMAGVYSAMGDYNRAIRELKGLLAGRADSAGIQRKIVSLYIRKKDFKEAERYAREIISSNIESDKGYQALAAVYIADRRFQEAIDSLKTAETLNPQNLETKVTLGKTYAATENFQKALETFKGIEKFNPYYAPAYFLQANTLERMGRKKDAVEKHLKTLKLSPDYIPSLNNLAYLYAEGYGPVEEAVKLAQRAKKLAPENGSITDTLGWALFNKGDYDDALKQFIEATYYLPGEPAIRYHLGLAYLKKGMNNKAMEQLKNAIRIGRQSAFPEMESAKKELKAINYR